MSNIVFEKSSFKQFEDALESCVTQDCRTVSLLERMGRVADVFAQAKSQIEKVAGHRDRNASPIKFLCNAEAVSEDGAVQSLYQIQVQICGPSDQLTLTRIQCFSHDSPEVAEKAIAQSEEKMAEKVVEKEWKIQGRTFVLSDEMMANLSGSRGSDHNLGKAILEQALKKKIPKLKDLERTLDFRKTTGLDWYFRGTSNKVCNLVLRIDHVKRLYIVLTGYWMPDTVARERHRKVAKILNYDAWVKSLPVLGAKNS